MLLSLGKICLSYCEIETRKVSFQILLSCLVFAAFYFEKEYRLSWVRFIRETQLSFINQRKYCALVVQSNIILFYLDWS